MLSALPCRPEPKYEAHVPSHSFMTPERTYNDIVRSYSRLYIASDFTHLIANWTQVGLFSFTLSRCDRFIRRASCFRQTMHHAQLLRSYHVHAVVQHLKAVRMLPGCIHMIMLQCQVFSMQNA